MAQGGSQFLNHLVVGDDTRVICPDCDAITCIGCKQLVDTELPHVCMIDDYDVKLGAHVDSLPEDERWLWQRYYRCRHWIEKSEACNHMT